MEGGGSGARYDASRARRHHSNSLKAGGATMAGLTHPCRDGPETPVRGFAKGAFVQRAAVGRPRGRARTGPWRNAPGYRTI